MKPIYMEEILQDKNKTNDFLQANENLVWKVINQCFLGLANEEDYFQEGMIGLYDAMKRYDESKKCEFSTLAYICIKSSIANRITANNRQKRIANNNTISIYKSVSKENEDFRIIDMLKDRTDIENSIVESYDIAERHNNVIQILNNKLSPRRKEVLQHILMMKSQTQIARDMNYSKEYIRQCVKKILEEASKISA